MIIAGSQGHAHEVYEVLIYNGFKPECIAFFDDYNIASNITIPEGSTLLTSIVDVKKWMISTQDKSYVYGLGGAIFKFKIHQKFAAAGAQLATVIAKTSIIGTHDVKILDGVQVMHSCTITTRVHIGKHTLINAGVKLMHDVKVGNACEIGPMATLLGRVTIGDSCFVGANATILPDVTIGNNVTIGAGSVVTQHIPSDTVAVGIPAKVIKNKIVDAS